ncbi:hypothetical protein FRC12_001216 [Ceratobasidium sp. 428]|nr:hypothetical protein FRC12_001216 [Ceratobasidium sp. 428]
MSRIQSYANTPFDHLPDPIISDIFVLIWNSWDLVDEAWGDAHESCIPYVLAAVSRRWRTIALSTSKIWTFVDLSFRAEYLATHLARSKNLRLDVSLALDEDIRVDLRELLHIFEETDSWARIGYLDASLDLDRISLLVNAINGATDTNPISPFRGISIATITRDHGTRITSGQLNIHIPQSQTLCRISLDHVTLPLTPDLPLSPLPGLQHFELKSVEITLPDSLLPFLELTPNLEHLTLKYCRVRSTPSITTSIVRPRHSIALVKLNSLNLLGAEGVAGLNLLFHTLDMPQLRHLTLCTYSDRPWTHLNWEAVCQSRALRYLVLQGFSSEALAGLLLHIELLNQLEGFELNHSLLAAPDEFAGQFVRKLLDLSSCPRLSVLIISFPLKDEHTETMKALRHTRPELYMLVELDGYGYEDLDIGGEDQLSWVENEEDYVDNVFY